MFSENLLDKHGDVVLQDKWNFANFVPARKERAVGRETGENQIFSEDDVRATLFTPERHLMFFGEVAAEDLKMGVDISFHLDAEAMSSLVPWWRSVNAFFYDGASQELIAVFEPCVCLL